MRAMGSMSGLPHDIGMGMGRLAQDPWGSSRLNTWGVSGHAVEPWQMGASEGAGLGGIAMPPGFSNLARVGAGAFGGAGVGLLNGGKSHQEMQKEMQMQAELSRVKRERDELEKRLREMEAASASLPPPPLPSTVMPPPAAPAAAGVGRAAADELVRQLESNLAEAAARVNAKAPREAAAKPERKQDAAAKKRDTNSKARVGAAESDARDGLFCDLLGDVHVENTFFLYANTFYISPLSQCV